MYLQSWGVRGAGRTVPPEPPSRTLPGKRLRGCSWRRGIAIPLCVAVCKQERHCLSRSLSGVCRECEGGCEGLLFGNEQSSFWSKSSAGWGVGAEGESSFCFSRARSSPHGLLPLFQQRDAKAPLSIPSCTLGLGS